MGGRSGRVHEVSVGKCVGVWGGEEKGMGGVGEGTGKKRCEGCEKVWGNVWKSAWGECGECKKVCWGLGKLWLGELGSGSWGRGSWGWGVGIMKVEQGWGSWSQESYIWGNWGRGVGRGGRYGGGR